MCPHHCAICVPVCGGVSLWDCEYMKQPMKHIWTHAHVSMGMCMYQHVSMNVCECGTVGL